MNNLNVIWLLIDSVRVYRSGLDDRDRLDIMDELASEMIEFTNMATSAPSSVMSVSAMMTGMPAYRIARDYDNFKFDPQAFSSLAKVLEESGYQIYGLVFYQEGRKRFTNLFKQVSRRYWPKNINPHAKYWTNDEVNAILQNLLADGLKEPFFLFVHYNIRGDPKTSEKIARIISYFKKTGVYDRSIFILCSDHGYPDPARSGGSKWFKEQGMTHDFLMTNDNLFIPFLLHYPGAESRKISTSTSSLDIPLTILDLLQIEPDEQMKRQMEGYSLKPLIEGKLSPDVFESRYVRADSRLFFQRGRSTVLIRGQKKYVYHHDTGHEAFFDFAKDPMETKNLINRSEHQEEIATFRKAYKAEETKLIKHHIEYMVKNFRKQRWKSRIGPRNRIILIDLSDWNNIDSVLQTIQEALQASAIDLLTDKEHHLAVPPLNAHKVFPLITLVEKTKELKQTLAAYDKVVVIGNHITHKKVRQCLGFHPKNILTLDSNMDSVSQSSWKQLSKILKARLKFYKIEPHMVLSDMKTFLNKIGGVFKS